MFGLGLGRMGVVGGGLTDLANVIRALFTAGKKGAWYDPSDLATQYQDSAGTTPVTAVTQPVGKANDKSGNAIHLLQATSGARPTLSARVNTLTATEFAAGLSDSSRSVGLVSAVSGLGLANGINTGILFGHDGVTSSYAYKDGQLVLSKTVSVFVKMADGLAPNFNSSNSETVGNDFALVVGGGALNPLAYSVTLIGSGLYRVSGTDSSAGAGNLGVVKYASNSNRTFTTTGYQLVTGTDALRYQRVNTDPNYDTIGFPKYWQFDGVDDGLASATFTAGTLGSNMDVFIPVKRDTTATAVIAYSDATHYIGGVAVAGGSAAALNSGTPTHWVNGVQVAGGTATTQGQLDTAIGTGTWKIVEFRNVDMSTWTAIGFANLSGKVLAAGLGKPIISEANSDTVRTQIRQGLASEYGVTL